jgi:hypothetical protein
MAQAKSTCEAVARVGLPEPVKRKGEWLFYRCPHADRHNHGDRDPSLGVNPRTDSWKDWSENVGGKGGWSLAAFLAGVSAADKSAVITWLKERGLLGGHGSRSRIVAAYDYTDEAGKLLYQVVRYDPKDFRQRRPDGKGGWLWHLDCQRSESCKCEPKLVPVRHVLYRLAKVLKADELLAVAGEKDAETAERLGFVATTNSGGEGKWRPEYAECLRGKRVTIICDADPTGVAHGHDLARSVVAVTASLKLIEALPKAKDLTEWVELGGGDLDGAREQLLQIIHETPVLTVTQVASLGQPKPANGFVLTRLGELLAKPDTPVDYVVEDRYVGGTVVAVVAKPKVGKSTFSRNLCFAVARGNDFLGSKTKKGECIYLALEELEDEVKRDFRAMGASGDEEIYIHASPCPADGIRELCDLIRKRRPMLVVGDPLFRLARVKDEKAYAETYTKLGPLIDVARETGTLVVLNHHAGKGLKADAIDSPLGSTAIGGLVSTLIVIKRTEAYRTIQTVQRIGPWMPETVLQFDLETRRLSIGGTRFDAERKECEADILEWLKGAADAKTEPEITEAVEAKTRVVRHALRELVKEGKVTREGGGKKGDPYRYLFSCSHIYAGTREQETQKAAETRENIEDNLVPKVGKNHFLFPLKNSPILKPKTVRMMKAK